MKPCKSFCFIFFILLLQQFSFINTFGYEMNPNSGNNEITTGESIKDDLMIVNTPNGTEKVKTNIIRNGEFEEENNYFAPSYFNHFGSTSGHVNSTYTEDVYAGTYAGYVSSKGTNQMYSTYFNYRELGVAANAYIDQIIYTTFWFNTKANPDIASGARTFFRIRLSTSSSNYYLNYYLSSNSIPVNTTTNAYFDVREPTDGWYNIYRNITYDIEHAFGSFDSSWHILTIYFSCQSVINPMGETILLMDDVSITNSTAHEFLAINGDFENGNSYPWYETRSDPGYAYLTPDDYTEGTRSLNMTAHSLHNQASSDVSIDVSTYIDWYNEPKGYYVSQPNNFIINFDWKYIASEKATWNQHAILSLFFQNSTFNANICYVLGLNSTIFAYGNYSGPGYACTYFKANNFDQMNLWHHFSLDPYTLFEQMNYTNLVLTYITFQLSSYEYSEKRIQLLVDALEISTYPTGDPSFEEDWYWDVTDPIPGWVSNFSPQYTNLTKDAHTGTYALNVTAHTNPNYYYTRRNMYLPVKENLYTDFWWKLDALSSEPHSSAMITLILDNIRTLNYVLGASSGTTFYNDTENVYYYVKNYNQTGVWNNLFRNIREDVIAAFGENIWNITHIMLASNTNEATAKVSTLFDDIHFVRDIAAPEISNVQLNPAKPRSGEQVTVTVDVTDNIQVDSVVLHYKISTASWESVSMMANGIQYSAEIPAAESNTEVQYFIVAQDVFNLINSLGNDTHPLSYTIQPLPWYILTLNFIKNWWPYLTAGAGALLLGILIITIAVKVKKKKSKVIKHK